MRVVLNEPIAAGTVSFQMINTRRPSNLQGGCWICKVDCDVYYLTWPCKPHFKPHLKRYMWYIHVVANVFKMPTRFSQSSVCTAFTISYPCRRQPSPCRSRGVSISSSSVSVLHVSFASPSGCFLKFAVCPVSASYTVASAPCVLSLVVLRWVNYNDIVANSPPPPPHIHTLAGHTPHAISPAGPTKQKLHPPWPINCQMVLNKLDWSILSPCQRSKSTTKPQYMCISVFLFK